MSFRKQDNQNEREFSKFLFSHLYNNTPFDNPKRVHGKKGVALQISGIDTVVELEGNVLLIDEKAQLGRKYINNPTKTYALELSFIGRDGKVRDGWFVDDTKKTTHYLFCYIHKATDIDALTKNSFKTVEVILVNKERLLEYFNGFGLTPDKLKTISSDIRHNCGHGVVYGYRDLKDLPFHFSFSKNNLKEQPINIILNKSIYIELADFHKTIIV